MARFILLWVRKNENVDPIIERLSQSKAVRVVGLFAEPTSFCDLSCGRELTDAWQRNHPSKLHPVWGTRHCPLCGKVQWIQYHHLTNALEDKDLPYYMRSLSMTLKMPEDGSNYDGRTPEEIYGEEKTEAGKASVRENRRLISVRRRSETDGSAAIRRAKRRASRARRRNA